MGWLKSFATDLDRWQTLPRSDRRSVVLAAAGLMATWLALRVVSVRRWHAILALLLGRTETRSTPGAGALADARALARLVDAVARRLPAACRCLERATALWWLLARRGLPAAIRIGVRRDGSGIEAHAWVEIDGVCLDPPTLPGSRFEAFEAAVDPLSVR